MVGAGKARRVMATIVQRQEAYILVDARLQAGDLVVVEGFHRLRDGKDVSFETVTDGQSSAPGQSRNKTGS